MKNRVLLILLIVITTTITGCIETGDGSSTDTIYGIEKTGIIWKTYSIWLTHDNPSISDKKSYSAVYTVDNNDEELIKQLNEAYKSGKKIKLYYKNHAFYEPWKYSSDAVALIYKIEYVN